MSPCISFQLRNRTIGELQRASIRLRIVSATNIQTLAGRIRALSSMGTRHTLLGDALGSVNQVVSAATSVTSVAQFSPFGYTIVFSGASVSRLQWLGIYGYRTNSTRYSELYVRMRHYSITSGTWTTVDALWPRHSQYAYCEAQPTNQIDPSGLASCNPRVVEAIARRTCALVFRTYSIQMDACANCDPAYCACILSLNVTFLMSSGRIASTTSTLTLLYGPFPCSIPVTTHSCGSLTGTVGKPCTRPTTCASPWTTCNPLFGKVPFTLFVASPIAVLGIPIGNASGDIRGNAYYVGSSTVRRCC